MATSPVIPMFIEDLDLDYALSDDESTEGDIDLPTLDLSDDENVENDEFEDDEDVDTLTEDNDFAFFLNPRKNASPFPNAFPTTQRVPVQPIAFTPQAPIVPFPKEANVPIFNLPKVITPVIAPQVPKVIAPVIAPQMGLRLAVLPTPTVAPTIIPPVNKPINAIPQLTGLIPAPHAPQIINLKPTTPIIPQLGKLNTGNLEGFGGLTITPAKTPNINTLPAQATTNKAIDVEAILTKMQGINVSGITPATTPVPADIESMFQKETDESPEDFEARRRLTLKLASIPDYKLNNSTAVVAGLIMMKKSKLGITFDPDVQAAITYLTSLLQR